MLRRFVPLTTAFATALVAGLLLVPAGSATAAPTASKPKPVTLAVYGSFKDWTTVRSGAKGGIGNLGIGTGSVSATYGGSSVGTVTAVTRVVAKGGKDSEIRDTQLEFALGGGTILAQGVNEDPIGKAPQTLHIMPVVGGTGAYATARGTLMLQPIGNKGDFRFAIDVFVDQRLAKSAYAFGTAETSITRSSSPQGIGTVTLSHASGAKGSLVTVATQIGKKGSTVSQSIDLVVETPTGTLLARSIVAVKGQAKSQRFAILGGTGANSGDRGELTLTPTAAGPRIEARIITRAGKPSTAKWFESEKTVANATVTGATQVASLGPMTKKKGGGGSRGTWNGSVLTYDDSVGGFQPVVTTLEQTFTEGTMIVTSITNGAVRTTSWNRPIIGGTGDFGGAAGQAVSTPLGGGQWQRAATFWR